MRKTTNTNKKVPCWVYVPENFDPDTLLPLGLRSHADSARYLLHRIIWGHAMRNRTLDSHVPLKFDYLREVIPDRLISPLKQALIAADVIECDRHFIEGQKSLGYRLHPQYRNARIIRVAIGDVATAKKVRANRRAKQKKVRLDVHCWLRSKFKRLEVDLPRAMSLLSDHRRFEVVKIPVEQVAYKETEFGLCRYGRVHSSLTRCSRRVRPALHVAGNALVSLDIANSQPLFLSLLVINYRRQGNKTFGHITFPMNATNQYRTIDQLIKDTVSSFGPIQESVTPTSSLLSITTRNASSTEEKTPRKQDNTTTDDLPRGNSVNRDFLTQDEQSFVTLCEQGKLYRTLKDEMKGREMPLRNWVKTELFEVLFGSNRLKSRLKDIFQEMYPGVAEVIRVHKRKDYAFLPRLLQNIEANVVINGVCRRLMVEMPEVPVYTIHDSILTTRPFVEPIRQIIFEEFARLGLTPTLHEKDYGESTGKATRGP